MREERRTVTALFADLVGSTALTERLDPEDARDLFGPAIRELVEAIEHYGGTVKDLAGDGVLGFFGAPVAHEDDAERAVRAGLRIVQDIASSAPELGVRVGIESGLVALGPVGAGSHVEYGATGDSINVAARLVGAAMPGSVLVGAATQHRVAYAFSWSEPEVFELKGKTEPVTAYRALGLSHGPRQPRTTGRPELLFGRDRETASCAVAARDLSQGRGGYLVIIGEAGVGKSRLVQELRRLVDQASWLEARCASYDRASAYLPYRQLLSQWCGKTGADEYPHLDQIVEALEPDVRPYIAHLLGAPLDGDLASLSPEALHSVRSRRSARSLSG